MSDKMSVDAPAHPKLDLDKFISTALSSTPATLHPFFEDFRNLYNRKLWHQLTLKLQKFYGVQASKPYRLDTFETFVRDFETKLNPLALVQLAVRASHEIDNPEKHQAFLQNLLTRITPTDTTSTSSPTTREASVLLQSSIAHTALLYGDFSACATNMEKAKSLMDTLDGCDNTVRAAYFHVAADYYRGKAEYGPYYRNSLLYLACVDPLTDMSPSDRLSRAHSLSIAALLGDTIYNFGELLMHPILDALDEPPSKFGWLKKLLFTFNEGSIGKFDALAPMLPQEPILQENYSLLRQKICLMALIESVFKRSNEAAQQKTGTGRIMSFKAIADETHLPANEVEHLVMKALSLKLIRGSLDQVDSTAHITWVQPRVLSREQISGLSKRLEGWVQKLESVESRVTESNKVTV